MKNDEKRSEPSIIHLANSEALKSAREIMSELVRAANQDRRLLGNLDWQALMIHGNRLVGHLQWEEETQLSLFALNSQPIVA